MNSPIRHALNVAGFTAPIADTNDLSGGCIHRVSKIVLDDGQRIVAKTNSADNLTLFEQEAQSLRALAVTETVLVPSPLLVMQHENTAVLLMTAIQSASREPTPNVWRRFGEELAALHRHDAGNRYGFNADNHIGRTLQPNSWRNDWVEFNAINRLGFQLSLALKDQRLREHEAEMVQTVIDRLHTFLPRHPKPALLHGDLWSGNALAAATDSGDRIAVIDPACSIGDGWADIAMMRLFGGFPPECFQTYASLNADHDGIQERIAVYQLYHVLNHLNMFGRGYATQAVELVRSLLHGMSPE